MANRTYSTLLQVVSHYLGTPATTGVPAYIAGLAINEAIREADTRQWWFTLTRANFTLATNTRSYVLSTSWPGYKTHLATVLLSEDGTRSQRYLMYLPPEEFMRARFETTNITGVPSYFTILPFDDEIKINTAPTSDLNGRIVRTLYYKKIPLLVNASDTLGIDDSGEQYIVQEAIWRAKRLAQMDYANDKAVADQARRMILATPQSDDVSMHGVM